jgi:hypothetical protein
MEAAESVSNDTVRKVMMAEDAPPTCVGEDAMRYWWEIPYVLAILQTDEPSMHNALFEAIAAMEQRRMTLVNAAEEVALAGAEAGLQLLIGERTANCV